MSIAIVDNKKTTNNALAQHVVDVVKTYLQTVNMKDPNLNLDDLIMCNHIQKS